ncbi:DUF6383 domain-containing protein [Parabacteroides goldsteinii]|uniref:DUF6383 domain-containing protein n=1 Tax=Parabacteroides goldsteinii TaxID=328812 RepID=UPI00242DE8AB|nr:DUF6383 domain-containing protein [Parabacteroides goldsteinii]
MNKKFSTLLVSLLLAGAWTTLDAAVVKTTPVIGGTYAIGTGDVAETMMLWNSGFSVSSVAVSGNAKFVLEQVPEKAGQFYIKMVGDESQYLCKDADGGSNDYLKWAADGNKIVFEIKNGQIVNAKGSTDGFKDELALYVTADDKVRLAYDKATIPADAKSLVYVAYNEDVKFAGENLPLQATITANEYYVIAADGTHVLKADGTTAAMVAEADLDQVLWAVTTGTAADGKTVTYKFTNKATGKVLVIENRDNFIVAGSPASFTLGVGEGQLLDADLKVGTAVNFGIYKSPIVKLNSDKLNAMLNDGFNMTIKRAKGDNKTIEGAEAFAGDLEAVQEDATRFQLKSGDKFVVLNKKALWGANLGAPDNRGAKFELVSETELKGANKANYLSYFEFTQYAGGAEDVIDLVSVFAASDADDAFGNLFVQTLDDKAVLTTSYAKDADDVLTETWPYITLGANNIVNPKEFLQDKFAVIKALNEEGAEDDEFLAATCEDKYIWTKTVANDLEKQWAIAYNEETEVYTIVNREDKDVEFTIAKNELRENGDKTDNIYVWKGGDYEIKFVPVDDSKLYYKYLAEDAAELNEKSFEMSFWSNVFEGYAKVGMNDAKNAIVGTSVDAVEFTATKTGDYEVKSLINYYEGNTLKKKEPVLKAPIYKFNVGEGFFKLDEDNKASWAANTGTEVVIRKADKHFNLVEATATALNGKAYVGTDDSYMYQQECVYSANKNTLFEVNDNNRPEYRRLGVTVKDGYNDIEGELNILKFFRTNDENQFLYENTGNRNAQNGEACLNFLGETNLADKPASAQLPFLVDTAYIRNNTRKPLYMLAVRSEYQEAGEEIIPCPVPGHGTNCEHATKVKTPAYRTADYLVALDDSTDIYPQAKYQGDVRLAFVPAKHIADTLVIESSNGAKTNWFANDSIKFSDRNGKQIDKTPAAFAFKLVDRSVDPEGDKAAFIIENQDKNGNKRYVRIHNTVPVLVSEIDQAAEFEVMAAAEGEAPTANEGVETTTVTVIATDGGVIVKGAEGKNVVITNVLGQTIANTVVSSSEATIAAPAGVVVVAVEGEAAVKAIVK